jgi:hypothetical protein
MRQGPSANDKRAFADRRSFGQLCVFILKRREIFDGPLKSSVCFQIHKNALRELALIQLGSFWILICG